MSYLIKKLKRQKYKMVFLIIFFLIFSTKFQFFLNIYIVLKNKIEKRMVSNYGYCYPLGYGFINEIYLKRNLHEYNINTKNKNISPTSDIFKFSFKNKNLDYEILLNYKVDELKKINKKFLIIESNGECHLVKYLND